jgi:hypothetical protein
MRSEGVRNWDRVISYVLFIAYGAYSIFYPLVSVARASEHWAEILLGVDFIFAGAAMLYGLYYDRYSVWKMGMTVAFIGAMTVTLLIAFVGGAEVLAYAFLFGAFAMQSLYGIRRERNRRIEWRIRRELETLVASARPGETP